MLQAQADSTSAYARYRYLVAAVAARGDRFPKDHGAWIRLWLHEKAGLFIQLDTWSSALDLRRGDGTYTAAGCKGVQLEHLGIDFGGFTLYASRPRIEALIRVVDAIPVK